MINKKTKKEFLEYIYKAESFFYKKDYKAGIGVINEARAIKGLHKNPYYYLWAGEIFMKYGLDKNILIIYDEFMTLNVDFVPIYNFFSDFFLNNGYYDKAASCYDKLCNLTAGHTVKFESIELGAIQFKPNPKYLQVLREYSQGMAHWQSYVETNSEQFVEKSIKHFYRCSELVKDGKLDNLPHFRFLPHFLMINKQTNDFQFAEDLGDLKNRVTSALIGIEAMLNDFTRNHKNPLSSLTSFMESCQKIPIGSLFLVKIYYLLYLARILGLDESINPFKVNIFAENKKVEKNIIEWLNSTTSIRNDYEEVLFKNLLVLDERIGGRSINDISKTEQGEFVNILFSNLRKKNMYVSAITDELTLFLKPKIEDQTKSIKKYTADLIKPLIRELLGASRKNGDKPLVCSEKNIKILPNVDDRRGMLKPTYYLEFKGQDVNVYLEIGKEKKFLFKRTKTNQPYQLLEYFLNKENRRVHWVEAIRIFTDWQEKRTKEVTGLEDIFRVVVAKIISEMNIEREKLIEEKIIVDRMNIDRQQGFYTLKTLMGSNITESAKLVKEADQFIDLDNFSEAAEKIVSALRIYDKSIRAAMLILDLKEKTVFEDNIINSARDLLFEQRDILELKVKPTIEHYIRKKEKFKWLEIYAKREFDYIEHLIENINFEIEMIKQCLKGFPKTRDKKFEEIKNLIKRDLTKPENANKLLKKIPILVVIHGVTAEVRKRQKRDTNEVSWAWFKTLDSKQLQNSAGSWLIQAIQSSKEKRNIDFVIARNLKILSYYLYKITIFEAEKEMLRHRKGELTDKEISDLKKATKFYGEIMQEYSKMHHENPSKEVLENLLGEKARAHRSYGQYLLSLLEKGGELRLEDWYKDNKTQNDT